MPDFIQDHSTSPGSGADRWQRVPPPTDVPLPDFALDSSASSGIHAASAGGFDVGPLPDIDPDNQLPPPGLDLHGHIDYSEAGGGARSKHRPYGGYAPPDIQGNGHISNSDAEEEDPDEILAIPQANATGGLPDFLSDSAVNSVDMRSSLENPIVSDDFPYHANGDYDLELRRVCGLRY